jgi:tetratricopeptide (TPR) repeat protein
MLREQRRYDDALAAYSKAIEIGPDSVLAWQGRAKAYRLKGDLDAATKDITRALQINPNSAGLRNDLGLIFVQRRQFDRAVEQYDAALRLSPDNAVTYSNRAISHRRLGNFPQAFTDFEQAIRLRPDNPEPWGQRANLKVIVRDHAGALADADQAIRIRSNNSFAFNVKGLARAGLGDFAAALREFDEAIRINAQNPVYFANRGEIYEKQGDTQRALEDFSRAVELPGGFPDLDVAQNRARQMRDSLLSAQGRAIPPPTLQGPPAGARPQPALPTGPVIEAARPKPGQGILVGVPKSIGTRRIALIIGNSAYRFAGALANPRNDASDVAAEFRRLGFGEVIERYDLTLAQLADELKKFGDMAEKADWAVVYYAGHGMEVDGINYLVPIDAQLKKASHISDEALPLDRLVSKVEGASKLRLVILDACRNNPFATKAERDTRTRTIGKGLASIEPDGGTLIAFAARGGTEALDGQGRNSPYAQNLLRHLREPGLDVRFLFDKVRDSVQSQTNRVQVPFTYGSLPPEQFIFKE